MYDSIAPKMYDGVAIPAKMYDGIAIPPKYTMVLQSPQM